MVINFGEKAIDLCIHINLIKRQDDRYGVLSKAIDAFVVCVDDFGNASSCAFTDMQLQENVGKDYSEKILAFCNVPRTTLEIAKLFKFKQRKSARKYIIPLVEQGRLAMTIPEKPNSRLQKYVAIK